MALTTESPVPATVRMTFPVGPCVAAVDLPAAHACPLARYLVAHIAARYHGHRGSLGIARPAGYLASIVRRLVEGGLGSDETASAEVISAMAAEMAAWEEHQNDIGLTIEEIVRAMVQGILCGADGSVLADIHVDPRVRAALWVLLGHRPDRAHAGCAICDAMVDGDWSRVLDLTGTPRLVVTDLYEMAVVAGWMDPVPVPDRRRAPIALPSTPQRSRPAFDDPDRF